MEECIDISKLESKKIPVSVDGIELPLKIGDRIVIEESDKAIRTIAGVRITASGTAVYCLEWFNGTEFKEEWASAAELWHICKSINKKNVQGFSS